MHRGRLRVEPMGRWKSAGQRSAPAARSASMPSADQNHPHAIACFEDRLILEARAPISEDELADVAARCAGPIPPGLTALWQASFGGTLDYGLSIDFDGTIHEFSFTELYFPGSNHYHDLFGWIDHEAELAEEAGAAPGEKLRFLPFGGFEYLERIYVCVEPGPDHGAIFAYAQGLPAAWTLQLNRNSVARIADDVPALFRMLDLPVDPATLEEEDFGHGLDMMEAVDQLRESDPDRADMLAGLVRSAVIDWRGAMADGTLPAKQRHRRIALSHASSAGDIALLSALQALGCDLNEPFRGGGGALDHALAHGKEDAARWLMEQGCEVHNAVRNGAGQISAALVAELLARGAIPDGMAASAAARAGDMASAQLIADALARVDLPAVRKLIDDLAHWAGRADATAERIDAGTLWSNRTVADSRSEGERMRALRNHCQSLLAPDPPRPFWRRMLGQ